MRTTSRSSTVRLPLTRLPLTRLTLTRLTLTRLTLTLTRLCLVTLTVVLLSEPGVAGAASHTTVTPRVAISPAVGSVGTKALLVARDIRPRSGRVVFSLTGADGVRFPLGVAKVSRTGQALVRVVMKAEGLIAAQHLAAPGRAAIKVGGTHFRFPTTPPSTGVIEGSNRGYASVTENAANRTFPVVGLYYTVAPTAPARAEGDFVISCDGAVVEGTMCAATTPGRHRMTVADLYNQYAPISFEWNAVAPIRVTAPLGEPVVFAVPPGASQRPGPNGIACPQGTCSVPAGSQPVAGTDGSLLDTFTIDFLAVGDTVPTTQQFVVTIFSIAAPSQTTAGEPFTVMVSGATPSTGRIDFGIDGVGIGTENVSATGSATFTSFGWSPGPKTLTATWTWFDVGVPRTMTVSKAITLM